MIILLFVGRVTGQERLAQSEGPGLLCGRLWGLGPQDRGECQGVTEKSSQRTVVKGGEGTKVEKSF